MECTCAVCGLCSGKPQALKATCDSKYLELQQHSASSAGCQKVYLKKPIAPVNPR